MSTEDPPETGAEAVASGLGLAALRTLVERYEPEREGAPMERFDERWDTVNVAREKGVVYLAEDDRLYQTDSERLAECDNYQESREAARATAQERGHEVVPV